MANGDTTDGSGAQSEEPEFDFDACKGECDTLKAQAMEIEMQLESAITDCADAGTGDVLTGGAAGSLTTFEQCLGDVKRQQEEAARLHEEAAACYGACLEQAANLKKLHAKDEEQDERMDDIEEDVGGAESDIDELFDQVEEVQGQSEANDEEIMNRLEALEKQLSDLQEDGDDDDEGDGGDDDGGGDE